MARFSKGAMISFLEARKAVLAEKHGFSEGDGWATVEGRDTEIIVAFGHFSECRDLIEDIESGL